VSEPRANVPLVLGIPPTPGQPSPDWTPFETPTQEQPFVYPPTPTSPTVQPEFEGTGARPKERRQSLTPASVSPKRRSSGSTPESSLSATRRFDTPYVRLPKIFKNAPLGYQSLRSSQDLTGELPVSSDDESVSGEDLLTQKTVRDLRKLKARGFDISFGEEIGWEREPLGGVPRGLYRGGMFSLTVCLLI